MLLILAAPVDKSGMSTAASCLSILIWLACPFVLEASEIKKQHTSDTIFVFFRTSCF